MTRSLLVVGLTMIVGVATPSVADVLCTTRSGALRARPACRAREKPVDVAALGPVGAPGARGDAGAPGPAIQLVDGTGRKVAEKVLLGDGSPALFAIGTVAVLFGTGDTGFLPYLDFQHEMPDCAGPRLIVSGLRPLVRLGGVLETTGYYAGDPIETHTIASRSYASTAVDCADEGGTFAAGFCCVNLTPQAKNVGPAVSVDMSAAVARFPASARPVP